MSNETMQGRPSTGRRFAPHSCPVGLDGAAQLRVSASAGSVASRVCSIQGLHLKDAVQAEKNHQPFNKQGSTDLQEHITCFQRQYGMLWS